MTKSDDKRVPALRFKGFTDEWEQRKLKDITQRVEGNNGNMNLPVLTISAKQGWMTQSNRFSSIIAGAEKKKYTLLKKGNLSYNHGNSKIAPFGTVFMLKTYSEALVPKVYHSFKAKKDINPYFLEVYFQTRKMDPQLRKYISSSARMDGLLNITYSWFEQVRLFLPNIEEQNKLEKLFDILNKHIELQQRKENQIKLLKKAMLQTLFTNKNVPQLRFKGFTDNWEQRKLNSFLVEYKKKTKINNQYPVLTSSRQGIFFQKDYYDGNQIASKNNIGYNIVPRNYFTYRHMSDDTIFHFNINTLCDYGIVSTLYPVFTTSNQLSSSWLYYYLNYGNDMKKYALLQKQGGSRTYMYFSKLKNMLGHIPNVKEQDSISKILLKTDNLITLQQNKTKKIENLKQFLLQNMFI